MAETEAFYLAPPTEEDLAVAQAAWLARKTRYVMRTDAPWWRVLKAASRKDALKFASTGYPSPKRQRFTPVFKSGQVVPAAYAGSTRTVSLWEGVLRSARHEGIRRIPEHQTRDRYLAKVSLCRTLHLLDIRRPRDSYLVAGGKRAPDLSAAWPRGYDLTRLWAQALYERLPDLDGIIYESHQVSGNCVILYQPQMTDAALFDVQQDPEYISEGGARELLLKEAHKAGVAVDFGEDDEREDSES
jgi:hypothetical protein